jgi:hypothetical protein
MNKLDSRETMNSKDQTDITLADEKQIGPQLTSLSVTHVQFDSSKRYSTIMACLTMSPPIITTSMIGIMLVTRDLTLLFILIGVIINFMISTGLKHYIKQPRPTGKSIYLSTCLSVCLSIQIVLLYQILNVMFYR